MDVAGLAVGLTGLATFFEAACGVWRAIRTASGFGVDIVDSIRRLEMEFFRFHTWWNVLQSLELRKVPTASPINNEGEKYAFLLTLLMLVNLANSSCNNRAQDDRNSETVIITEPHNQCSRKYLEFFEVD